MNTGILENKTVTALISAVKQINENMSEEDQQVEFRENIAFGLQQYKFISLGGTQSQRLGENNLKEGLTVYLQPQEISV